MLPVCSVVPCRTIPWICLGTVAVFAIGYAAHLAGVGRGTPAADSTPDVLIAALSSPWLHGGWLQLLTNGACLLLFGEAVEDRLGPGRFTVLIVGAALLGGLFQAPEPAGAGAVPRGGAGVVASVVGAHALLFPRSRLLWISAWPRPPGWTLFESPASPILGLWLALSLMFAWWPGQAPGGGRWVGYGLPVLIVLAVLGAGAGLILRPAERRTVDWWDPATASRPGRPARCAP